MDPVRRPSEGELRNAGASRHPGRPAGDQSIYAHHVLHGTGTFDEVAPSVEEITERFAKVTDHGWSWLVATDATGVLGYAYYTQFRDRSAYRYCVEDSVYVREDVRGQGVGKALVAKLIEQATAAGVRQMIAVIGDLENVGSIGVHASLGFTWWAPCARSASSLGAGSTSYRCNARWAAGTPTCPPDATRRPRVRGPAEGGAAAATPPLVEPPRCSNRISPRNAPWSNRAPAAPPVAPPGPIALPPRRASCRTHAVPVQSGEMSDRRAVSIRNFSDRHLWLMAAYGFVSGLPLPFRASRCNSGCRTVACRWRPSG